MIAVVTGGRDYCPTPSDAGRLLEELAAKGVTLLRHGDCRGVDRWAAEVARRAGLAVEACPADWYRHGRGAGPIRNRWMLEGASVLVAFPGGRGTLDCVERAKYWRIPIVFVNQ